jgi:hypothetical protein
MRQDREEAPTPAARPQDSKVKISLNDSRLKTKSLRARPRCSLFIIDFANPFPLSRRPR